MYIYRIKFPDGKSYIGSTRDVKARYRSNLRNARSNKSEKIYIAIRKFGPERIDCIILKEVSNIEEALKLEKAYISIYDSYQNGYNSTPDGRGCTSKQVINLNTDTIYQSIKCASDAEGESHRAITRSANDRTITYRGNLFIFLDNYHTLSEDEKTYLIATLKFRSSKKLKSIFPNHRKFIIDDLKSKQLIDSNFQLKKEQPKPRHII